MYEAKGWSGDPREARHQACVAGAAYLDMLDALARIPGPPCVKNRDYQFDGSQNAQTFALTSFGAHWHVMVGYRRPRLKREHAGHPGMSDTVYVRISHLYHIVNQSTNVYRWLSCIKGFGAAVSRMNEVLGNSFIWWTRSTSGVSRLSVAMSSVIFMLGITSVAKSGLTMQASYASP